MLNSIKYITFCFVCIAVLFAGQLSFADSGKFYIIGMGTVSDLVTLRGVRAIEETHIVMLEDERDGKSWEKLIGKKEVWIIRSSSLQLQINS